MHLAKPCLDIGVFTNDAEAMLAFYRDAVGLPYEHLLALGGGQQQHRHGLNGSVFKLNHSRDALAAAPPTGYRRLRIARAGLAAPRSLIDPDGNAVELVPVGHADIQAIAIDIEVRDLGAHRQFWGELFGAEAAGGDRFRVGTTLVALHPGAPASAPADPPPRANMAGLRGRGFRYLTVQVFDCAAEHRALIAAGAIEGQPPHVLGDVAKISFVGDPDGNWIEISQRRSLTGPLA